jgi:Tol biopolymer transport system component
MEPLFDRTMQAMQPSFSSTGKLVFFSGFDAQKMRWKIYSYEFYYENLNELNDLSGQGYFPKVSPDTDRFLFVRQSDDFPQHRLYLANWYGKLELAFEAFNILDPSWGPQGLKIFFVSDKDRKTGEVYSIWRDGSHLERLTFDSLAVRNPEVSPDGRWLALSVKLADGFDIFLIPLEDY